jgi:hypothetical protein
MYLSNFIFHQETLRQVNVQRRKDKLGNANAAAAVVNEASASSDNSDNLEENMASTSAPPLSDQVRIKQPIFPSFLH